MQIIYNSINALGTFHQIYCEKYDFFVQENLIIHTY